MKFTQVSIPMATNSLKIAVLSGKGGTGKTLVSVNLAAASLKSNYIDCDVEEPNGHLFFKPSNIEIEDVKVKIPVVNPDLCNGCRKCVDFCRFNALAYISPKLHVFEDVCHSCGGCSLICPEKAISEKDKKIGEVQKGYADNVFVKSGILNTGEESGVPIIKKLIEGIQDNNEITFIDCPPGSSCVVMESIKDVDYCILVAEPSIFGSHNLNMVTELVKVFKKPHGVILNKYVNKDNPSEKYCIENKIDILGRIPFDTTLGHLNSNALISVREDEKFKELFTSLLNVVIKEVNDATASRP